MPGRSFDGISRKSSQFFFTDVEKPALYVSWCLADLKMSRNPRDSDTWVITALKGGEREFLEIQDDWDRVCSGNRHSMSYSTLHMTSNVLRVLFFYSYCPSLTVTWLQMSCERCKLRMFSSRTIFSEMKFEISLKFLPSAELVKK